MLVEDEEGRELLFDVPRVCINIFAVVANGENRLF